MKDVVKMWICGRLCAVHGQVDRDYDVGIWPHFEVDCILQLDGMEFTVAEHERLFEDDDLYMSISAAAFEVVGQRERLQIPDYDWRESIPPVDE